MGGPIQLSHSHTKQPLGSVGEATPNGHVQGGSYSRAWGGCNAAAHLPIQDPVQEVQDPPKCKEGLILGQGLVWPMGTSPRDTRTQNDTDRR